MATSASNIPGLSHVSVMMKKGSFLGADAIHSFNCLNLVLWDEKLGSIPWALRRNVPASSRFALFWESILESLFPGSTSGGVGRGGS